GAVVAIVVIEASPAKRQRSERGAQYSEATRNGDTVASIAATPERTLRIAADVSADSRRNKAVVIVPVAMLKLSRFLEERPSKYLSYNSAPITQPPEAMDVNRPM